MTLNTVMAHAMADAQRKVEANPPEKIPAYLRIYRSIKALRRANTGALVKATHVPVGTVSQYVHTMKLANVIKTVEIDGRTQYEALPMSESEAVSKIRETMADQGTSRRDAKKERPTNVVPVPVVTDLKLTAEFSPEAIVEKLTLKECKQVYDYLGTFFK